MAAARSPLASPAANHLKLDRGYSGNTAMSPGPRSSGYFPQMSQSPAADDKTVVKTVTNSHPNHQGAYLQPNDAAQGGPSANGKFTEEWDASRRGSSVIDGPTPAPASARYGNMQRSNSFISNGGEDILPMRSNTLKKKPSMRRSGSLKRSGSRRSMKAGSVRSLALQSSSDPDEAHSAFHCPVPTSANPTDVLASRFQAWRKLLKDLVAYFREIQAHYEHRSKSTLKLANVSMHFNAPPGFLSSGGVDDAMQILRGFNKTAVHEATRAREIEEDVILALTGLRSDLHQKIKEIKNLSGDFKNQVDKEMESTRRAVRQLQDVLGQTELDPSLTTGKQDPYLLRLAVDRQVERQIDEENYLHQAFLNLESSGRELESIVVGEIQKAYNAYASILRREADTAYAVVEELRLGPISMPKDHEWIQFTQKDDQFVDPEVPMRSAESIHYPGRDHVACQEIRAGLLERKSKYLKSYTAGWYVLSPTHLHEFKSADKAQAPVMSLYLPEQKLGSHSAEGGSSQKFILKGRQTGSMHRGHSWVFRAESHDTMIAWYEDIKALTEKTPQERSDFVRGHSRSVSRSSRHSMSSDGGVVDEDDDEPFSASSQVDVSAATKQDAAVRRPQPGGRFPSDIQVNAQRGLQAPLSPSSVSSGLLNGHDYDAAVASGALQDGGYGVAKSEPLGYGSTARTPLDEAPSRAAVVGYEAREDGVNPYTNEPLSPSRVANYGNPAMTSTAAARPDVSPPRVQSLPEPAPTPSRQGIDMTNGAVPVGGNGNAAPALGGGYEPWNPELGEWVGGPTIPPKSMAREPQDEPMRPTSQTPRNPSVPTISNLHMPGEYPKTPMNGPALD